MDLERLGRPDLAVQFLADHAEFLGDRYPPSLAEFYIAYRSIVRAKVAAIRWTQGAQGAMHQVRQLFAMALAHLERASVRIVVVGGLPGSGKSTLAAALADRHGWCLLRSDVVRRELFDLPSEAPGFDEGPYSASATGGCAGPCRGGAGEVSDDLDVRLAEHLLITHHVDWIWLAEADRADMTRRHRELHSGVRARDEEIVAGAGPRDWGRAALVAQLPLTQRGWQEG